MIDEGEIGINKIFDRWSHHARQETAEKLEKGSKINFDFITSFNERANEKTKRDSCDRTKNRNEDNFGKILSIVDFEYEDIKTENQTEKNKVRNKCTEHTTKN